MPNYKNKTGTKKRGNGSNSSRNMISVGGTLKGLIEFFSKKNKTLGEKYEMPYESEINNEFVRSGSRRGTSAPRSGSSRSRSGSSGSTSGPISWSSESRRLKSGSRLSVNLLPHSGRKYFASLPIKLQLPTIERQLTRRFSPKYKSSFLEKNSLPITVTQSSSVGSVQSAQSQELSDINADTSFSNRKPSQRLEPQIHNATPYKGKDYDFKPEILPEFKELLKRDIYYFERYPDTAPPTVDPINFDYKTGKCLLQQNLAKTVDFEACTKTHMNLAGSLKGKSRKIKNFLGSFVDVLPDTRIDGNPKFWVSRGVNSKRVYDYSNLYKTENAQKYKKLIDSGYLL